MIAEIVGVAGTGKSTIAHVVSQRSNVIQTDYKLRWRYVLPAYYARAVLAMPTYLMHYQGKGQVLWPALRWMTYLEKLQHALSRQGNENIILFDQGPVFWLTYLHTFGSDGIRDEWFTRWWTRALENWSSILDMIFYLDGDDTVLIERVRNRSKNHKIKGSSDQKAREYLALYREGYQKVLDILSARDGLRVRFLSTDRESLEKIVDQIMIELLAEGSC